MFYLFVNDEETNLLFEYHLIKMQLFLKKKIVLTMSLYYRAEEYHPVFIGGKKKKILVYISDVRGRMEYEY